MSADIVNLRKARKAKARAEEEKRAAENRIKFGRTKSEREAAAANEELARKRLEALKLARTPAASGTSRSHASEETEASPRRDVSEGAGDDEMPPE